MRLKKVVGLIVNGFPLGEADHLNTCFTSSGNLVKFVSKGSRKTKSKSAAVVQLYVLGEYVLYCGRGLPILRQGDIVESFSPLRRDWAKSGAAFAVIELCCLLIAEEARETEAFQLVMSYLLHLKTEEYDSIVFDSFRLKLAARLGYQMTFSCCAQCGRPLQRASIFWPGGGAACPGCQGGGGKLVSGELLSLMEILNSKGFSQLQGQYPAQAKAVARIVDGLINWLTQGKTKAQAFRSLFEA